MKTRNLKNNSDAGPSCDSDSTNRNYVPSTSEIALDQLSEESRALYMLLTENFESALKKLEVLVGKKDEVIGNLEAQVNKLRKANIDIYDRLDELENNERADMFCLSGGALPVTLPDEDTQEVVKRLIQNKLKCKLETDDIISSFRMGKNLRLKCQIEET